MNRFHVHLSVPDLAASIRFYSSLFGLPPTVERQDYAKWMLDDPRVNFAISHRSDRAGLNHFGLQVDEAAELPAVRERFAAADHASTVDEPGAHCCYAVSDKHWVTDPQGIAWEGFHSLGTIPLYDGDEASQSACGVAAPADGSAAASGCCAPSDAKPASIALPAAAATAKSGCCAPATTTVAAAAPRAACCS